MIFCEVNKRVHYQEKQVMYLRW